MDEILCHGFLWPLNKRASHLQFVRRTEVQEKSSPDRVLSFLGEEKKVRHSGKIRRDHFGKANSFKRGK